MLSPRTLKRIKKKQMWESLDANNKQKLRDYYVSVNKYDHKILAVKVLPEIIKSKALEVNKYEKLESLAPIKSNEYN